jgi:hypothetical protein
MASKKVANTSNKRKKYNQPVSISKARILTIRDRVFQLLTAGATTKELHATMLEEYQMPPRTVENHRAVVLKEMYEEYKKNHAKTIIEALMRKQEYINFWKEKYNQTEKAGYMARAEASEDGLNELKFRTNILPDASKPHIQINQQTNNTEVKPDIDVLLAALKADKAKTITIKPETSEKSEV